MTVIEIVVIVAISIFAFFSLLRLFGVKIEKVLFGVPKKKEKKPKKAKAMKAKKQKVKKSKSKEAEGSASKGQVVQAIPSGKKVEEVLEAEKKQEVKVEPAKEDEVGFKISRKGVAKISKKALDRDSRTLAKVEPVMVRGADGKTHPIDSRFDSFDDLLDKMKSVGDPDELDDETFRRLFMKSSLGEAGSDSEQSPEVPMSSSFVSLETTGEERNPRGGGRFSISGSHLRLGDRTFGDVPNRRPTLNTQPAFTERITGRYSNITMGDVSNRLAPTIEGEESKKQAKEKIEPIESDEDIFAKIMERRRRELGLEPQSPLGSNLGESDGKQVVINADTLVVADAIMNPKWKKNMK